MCDKSTKIVAGSLKFGTHDDLATAGSGTDYRSKKSKVKSTRFESVTAHY